MKTQQPFNIKITNTNLIIGEHNFLLSNLISARYEKLNKSTTLPIIALLGSLFLFLINPQIALLGSLLGIGWVFNSTSFEYELVVESKHGEHALMRSKNKEDVEEIIHKINKILNQRKKAISLLNF